MDLIDTHQHLILRGKLGYAWTRGEPSLAGSFTRADYAALVEGSGVIGTIFMETGVDDGDYRAEARLVAGMVGEGTLPMFGQIASCRPETDQGFDAWLEECRHLKVVGFRRILQVMPDDTSRAENYRRNVRKIGKAGWPVDLCFHSRQLAIAAELVRACPDVRFMLDHCGTPDIAGNDFPAWSERISDLASLPNLFVKLSGVTAYCAPGQVTLESVRPYVETVLKLFGPARMVWGGDWPVVDLGSGLPEWIAMTREFLSTLSPDEQASIGHGNARRFYLAT
ncbi:amidohydrolase family protein [Agrobacterium fabrum]|uniref:amidohydrolase family protein n=1 Tax=Agrobacterium fabrum TaxID=1176649 RepID=UPI000EF4BC46|nr:amidohydrolase [Agrobacterium fabrum]AYM59334.1 hypothetical protein At1D132_33220 [Agrobacterium fabrum]NSZ13413.1 amidohydrolase family protein [Agrobacterium fabrum]